MRQLANRHFIKFLCYRVLTKRQSKNNEKFTINAAITYKVSYNAIILLLRADEERIKTPRFSRTKEGKYSKCLYLFYNQYNNQLSLLIIVKFIRLYCFVRVSFLYAPLIFLVSSLRLFFFSSCSIT